MPPPTRRPDAPEQAFPPLDWLGSLLIAARRERGLTQHELASRLSKHQQVVARWESEKYRGASLENLVAVAAALGVEVRLAAEPGVPPDNRAL